MFICKVILASFALTASAMGRQGIRGPGGPGGPGGPPRLPGQDGGEDRPQGPGFPPRGDGPRGDGPFFDVPEELTGELTCAAEETFECSSRRLGNVTGILACRSIPAPLYRDGLEMLNRTVCVDPMAASITDECGCCDGACPTECLCDCHNGEGYLIEPVLRPRRSPFHGGNMDEMEGMERPDMVEGPELMEEGPEDDVFQVFMCVPKMKALTAVATGRATCLNDCTI